MFALSIGFGREPAQAPGWLWNPLVLLHLLQQLEPDEADMTCRTADPTSGSLREENSEGHTCHACSEGHARRAR